jgi:preprotein translocase subunit SecE
VLLPAGKSAVKVEEEHMPKRDKDAKKRAERRERARDRETVATTDESMIDVNGDGTATQSAAVTPPPSPAREKRTKAEEVVVPVTFKEQVVEFFEPLTDFMKEVQIEAKKINWPSRDEAWRSTMVVVVTIVFLAAFMGLFSSVFSKLADYAFTVRPYSPASAPSPATQPAPGTPSSGSTPPLPGGPTGVPTPTGAPAGGPTGGGTPPPAGGQ